MANYVEYEDLESMEAFDEFEEEALFLDEEDNGLFEQEAEAGPLVRKAVSEVKKELKKAKPSKAKVVDGAVKAAGAAVAGKKGAVIASKAARKTAQAVRNGEMEDEAEAEAEFEANGGDMALYGQMQYLADRAAEAESESEADEWIGALASVAGPLISSLLKENEGFEGESEGLGDWEEDEFLPLLAGALPTIAKFAAPLVKKGIGAIGKAIASPKARAIVRKLPGVALNTANALARQAAAGRPITPAGVAATLGRQTCRTFMSPARPPYPTRRYRQRVRRPAYYA